MSEPGLPEDFPLPSPSSRPLEDPALEDPDIGDIVEHRYATNPRDGVNIHYAAAGPSDAPLVVMTHGFPDFWYTWRHQISTLSTEYRVCAPDLRGYNLSDHPKDMGDYGMESLTGDIAAVIQSEGREGAAIVGHDWGGAISWQFAVRFPNATEKLIVLNIPHISGLTRELANNPEQQDASAYTRFFQQDKAHESLTPERLARWVSDPDAKSHYIKAFERSDFEAMLYYYKRHYPAEPYREIGPPEVRVQAPVLQIHGLADPYLLPDALAGTWDWVDGDYTLVTVPGAGHFVQQDAAEFVDRTILAWLSRRK